MNKYRIREANIITTGTGACPVYSDNSRGQPCMQPVQLVSSFLLIAVGEARELLLSRRFVPMTSQIW